MSELSESFQAYTSTRASVIAMLRGASISGLIAGSNKSCVSFVIEDPEREDDVIAASEGVLARYHDGEKLARAGVLGDVEAIALCRALESFSPNEPEEREHGLEVIRGLLGFAAHRWLSAAYAQASGPEEMRELFPGAEVVESE